MYLIFPLIYVVLGIIYGPIALWRRCKLHQDFKRLTPEQVEVLDRTSPVYQSKNGVQITSMIFTGLMLFSILLAGLSALGVGGTLGTFALLGVTALPLFVLGFNIPSVWNRQRVYLEELSMRDGIKLTKWHYYLLLPTWVIGICGSYVIAFNMIPQFS